MTLPLQLWGGLVDSLRKLGAVTLFLVAILRQCPAALARPRLISQQVHNSGVLSLVIIMMSAFFVGMVIGLQGYDSLARLRQEDVLGAVVALTLFKELGPVVTALLFAVQLQSCDYISWRLWQFADWI